MKKITDEEFNALLVQRGKRNSVRANAQKLEKGEKLQLERSDAKNKRALNAIIYRLNRKSGKKFISHVLLNGTGWVLERIA